VSQPKVIGVTGYARSGKDTFAAELVRVGGYVRLGFADALKFEVAKWLGISVAEIERRKSEFRATLQERGMHMRELDPRHWVRVLREKMQKGHLWTRYVIPDVRFRNEAEWIRKEWCGKIVRIVRTGQVCPFSHASETEVDAVGTLADVVVEAEDGDLERIRGAARRLIDAS
jgi:hypothetical protein